MEHDAVNNPSHYADGKIEVIEFIEDKNLGFHLGNVVKYICRAGKKDPNKLIEDLEKADWYLDRYIDLLKKQRVNDSVEWHPTPKPLNKVTTLVEGDVCKYD